MSKFSTAIISLTIDLDMARDMGLEIDDEEEYVREEMVDYIFSLVKYDEVHKNIQVICEEASDERPDGAVSV